MEIEGIIVMELPLEEGVSQRTGNPWRKKGWVLETMGQFPRKAMFTAFGDRIDNFKFEVGKAYSVSVDVESREFNGRWYTDLRVFNYRPLDNVQPGYPQAPGTAYGQPAAPAAGPQFGQPAAPAAPAAPVAPATPTLPDADPTEDLPF